MYLPFKALGISVGTAVIATLVSVSSVAQTRYCIGGDLDHLSAADRVSCLSAKEAVKTSAARLHAPEDWHFVVVCGEKGWRDYTSVSQRGEVALEDAAADTDLGEHVTYLRESRLSTQQLPELQRVVAHELASIYLNSQDERAIEAQLALWDGTEVAGNDGERSGIPRPSGRVR